MTYREILLDLDNITDNFSIEHGAYKVSDKSEVQNAINILSNYYTDVDGKNLDYRNKEADGTDYLIIFSNPIQLKESMKMTNEAIEKHDTLNPKLWDENNELKPEVRKKIEEIVQKFDNNLKENDVELDVKDIIIVGSNANYNYSPDSDVDIHIIADTSVYPDQEDLAMKVYLAYKSLFNNKYDPTLNGIEAEIYVEPDEVHANSNGVYSLKNGWLKEPEQVDVPDIDPDHVQELIQPFEDRYNDLINNPEVSVSDVDALIDDIYLQRQTSIMKDGEFGDGNICFKEFRNRGYLQNLRDLKVELENKEMSLNDMNEQLLDIYGLNEDCDDHINEGLTAKDLFVGAEFVEPEDGVRIVITDISDDLVTCEHIAADGYSFTLTDPISYVLATLNEYDYVLDENCNKDLKEDIFENENGMEISYPYTFTEDIDDDIDWDKLHDAYKFAMNVEAEGNDFYSYDIEEFGKKFGFDFNTADKVMKRIRMGLEYKDFFKKENPLTHDEMDFGFLDEAKYLGSCDDKKQIKDEKKKGLVKKDKKSKYDIKADESLREDKRTEKRNAYLKDYNSSSAKVDQLFDNVELNLKELINLIPEDYASNKLARRLLRILDDFDSNTYGWDEYTYPEDDIENKSIVKKKMNHYHESLDEGTAFDSTPGFMSPEEIRAKELADKEKANAEKEQIKAQKAAERKEKARAERAEQRRIDQREKVNRLSYDSLADMAGLDEDNNDLTKDELLAVLRSNMSDAEILKLHKRMFEALDDEEFAKALDTDSYNAQHESDSLGAEFKKEFDRLGLNIEDYDNYADMYRQLDQQGREALSNKIKSLDDSLNEDAPAYAVKYITGYAGMGVNHTETKFFRTKEEREKFINGLKNRDVAGVETYTVDNFYHDKKEKDKRNLYLDTLSEDFVISDTPGTKYKNKNGVIIEVTDPTTDGEIQFYIIKDGDILDCRKVSDLKSLARLIDANGYEKIDEDCDKDDEINEAKKTGLVSAAKSVLNRLCKSYEDASPEEIYNKALEVVGRSEYPFVKNNLMAKKEEAIKFINGYKEATGSDDLNEAVDDSDAAGKALADYLGISLDDIDYVGGDVYDTPEGEYLVASEEEAYKHAVEAIKNDVDDLGLDAFTPSFRDWILNNAIDEDAINDVIDREIDYYETTEDDPDMLEFLRSLDSFDDKVSYVNDIYADDFSVWAIDFIDLDKVADEAISEDGVAHFIAFYDGDEIDLAGDLKAYRLN